MQLAATGGGMSSTDPAVSIGMPVRNGMPYLEEAIDGILAQTFTDFELIISDNASTDGSWECMKGKASGDGRIRLTRHEVNHGSTANFNTVLALARAPLFAWAAHDDMRDPRWLDALVKVMTEPDAVVLAQSGVDLVDPEGKIREHYDCLPLVAGGQDADERLSRFRKLDGGFGKANIIYGLARTAALRAAGGLHPTAAGDVATLEEMVVRGQIVVLTDYLFKKRARYVT